MLILLCLVLGLAVGSFLNVVVWRVPRGESVVRPGSACPACAAPVRARDNVPVLGWLVLRGRCRDCSGRISGRYPLVEAATGALFVVLALRIGADAALPAYLYLAAVGLALALIDIDVRRLPDVLTLPSYVVVAGLLAAAALLGSESGHLLRAGLGGLAMYAAYFALCLAYPSGMGFGDVKLAGILGMATGWLGWQEWVVGLFAGFLLGGVWSLGLVAMGRAGRKTAVPYGPFMLLGCLLAVLVGRQLSSAYLGLTLS
jgi:leader peptidase (prepilin peptidase)/N-methyltransferase